MQYSKTILAYLIQAIKYTRAKWIIPDSINHLTQMDQYQVTHHLAVDVKVVVKEAMHIEEGVGKEEAIDVE